MLVWNLLEIGMRIRSMKENIFIFFNQTTYMFHFIALSQFENFWNLYKLGWGNIVYSVSKVVEKSSLNRNCLFPTKYVGTTMVTVCL